MTIDEMKAKLLAGEEEGADRAAIYDEVCKGMAETVEASTKALVEATNRVEALTTQVNTITETNLKLLDKVKYMTEQNPAEEDEDDDASSITIEELFKED